MHRRRHDAERWLEHGLNRFPAGRKNFGWPSLLEVHGVGPIVAGFILGHVGDPTRFATPDRFASYNGTAPIEASSEPASDTGRTRGATAN